MNPSILRDKEANLSGIVRKVYESTPISDGWEPSGICSDMRRLGHNSDLHTVKGCLAKLVEMGMVKESPRGYFKRVAARVKIVEGIGRIRSDEERVTSIEQNPSAIESPGAAKEASLTAPNAVIPAQESPIKRMYAALSELESAMQNLASAMAQAASAAEKLNEVAIEVDSSSNELQGKLETLERFRALLKDL